MYYYVRVINVRGIHNITWNYIHGIVYIYILIRELNVNYVDVYSIMIIVTKTRRKGFCIC